MPIYEFLCDECETRYEQIVLSRDAEVRCPRCGSERRTLQLSVFRTPRNGSSSPGASAGSGTACACTPRTCGCR